jgi:hypothetical protein
MSDFFPLQHPHLAIANDQTCADSVIARLVISRRLRDPRTSVTAYINTQNPAYVATSLARYAEFAETPSAFIQPSPYTFANLIFAILAMMTCAGNSVDDPARSLFVLHENVFKIIDCLFRMQT